MRLKQLCPFILLIFASQSCKVKNESKAIEQPTELFKQKWYAGEAELNSYDLQQARYGEMRKGEAVLIFVTEDFSKDKFVKIDDPQEATNKVSVLKMNMTKTFRTGIYPYSMMLSVFKPVSKNGLEKVLKVTCSSQEWCGHTFSQIQQQGNSYDWQLNSYFEKEAGMHNVIDKAMPEDEIWNHIRINPATLPTGKVSMIPGLLWQRLSHNAAAAEEAIATLSDTTSSQLNSPAVKMYTLYYPKYNRTLQILFQNVFPFEIIGWYETYPDGFGADKKLLTTKAVLKKTIWLAYWKLNSEAGSRYRDSLQVMRHE